MYHFEEGKKKMFFPNHVNDTEFSEIRGITCDMQRPQIRWNKLGEHILKSAADYG